KVDGVVEVDAWPAARLGSALSAAVSRAGGAVGSAARVDTAARGAAAPAQALSGEQLAQLREVLLAEVRRTSEAALKAFAQTEGRAIAEEAVRRSAATKTGGQAEQMASIAREAIGDTITRLERLETAVAAMQGAIGAARQAAETAARAKAPGRLPKPTAAGDALKPPVNEQLLREGRGRVEEAVAALTREVVPPLAERLVRQQLERLPNPTATVDELLPQLKEQILREGRG